LLVASGAVLVFKHLPSIKIWYTFNVLSKKKYQPCSCVEKGNKMPQKLLLYVILLG
jgi:hypothetical protein